MSDIHAFDSQEHSHLCQSLEGLYRERTLLPFKVGQTIPLRRQEMWIVYRGLVQVLTLHSTGDEVLLGLVGPLMPLGLSLTLLEPYQAVAMTNVDLLRLSVDEVRRSPHLARELNEQLTRRLHHTEALLALSGKRMVVDRLYGFLMLIANEYGLASDEGTLINMRLTHQQLANAIGTTRVTVTRCLGELKDAGLVGISAKRRLYLKKPEPLATEDSF